MFLRADSVNNRVLREERGRRLSNSIKRQRTQTSSHTHLSFISWYRFSFMYSNIKYKWSFSRMTSLSLITLAWLSFFKDWKSGDANSRQDDRNHVTTGETGDRDSSMLGNTQVSRGHLSVRPSATKQHAVSTGGAGEHGSSTEKGCKMEADSFQLRRGKSTWNTEKQGGKRCPHLMHGVNKRLNQAHFGPAVFCGVTCLNGSTLVKLSLLGSSSRKEGV